MTKDAPTTSTYPFPIVRIVCVKCGRQGQYRRQTLIDRFEPDASIPDVIAELVQCPDRMNYSDICQVRCPDLRGTGIDKR
jgi:hypothetical protein